MTPNDPRNPRNTNQQQNVKLANLRLTLLQRLSRRPKTSEDSIVFPIQPSNGFYGDYEYVPNQLKSQELKNIVEQSHKDINETTKKAQVNKWAQLGIYIGVSIPCLVLIYIPIHLIGSAIGIFKFPQVVVYYLIWFIICIGISCFAAYVADKYRQRMAFKRGRLLSELVKRKDQDFKKFKAKIVLSKDLSWYQVRLNVNEQEELNVQ